MKSNNPVFSRSEEFNRASSNAYGNQTYAGGRQNYPGYGETPGQVDGSGGRMTVDSVVQKTAISIALVFATAFATWWWIGDIIDVNTVDQEACARGARSCMGRCGIRSIAPRLPNIDAPPAAAARTTPPMAAPMSDSRSTPSWISCRRGPTADTPEHHGSGLRAVNASTAAPTMFCPSVTR